MILSTRDMLHHDENNTIRLLIIMSIIVVHIVRHTTVEPKRVVTCRLSVVANLSDMIEYCSAGST